MILPSAGTASPASSITMSPGTRSEEWSTLILLSLNTLHVAAVIVCRASIAASALLSWITPSTALRSTTATMITTSVHSPSPLTMPVRALTAAAIIKMMSIGSLSWARKRWKTPGFSASLSLFGPCSVSLFSASLLSSPFSVLFTLSSVSLTDSEYISFIFIPLCYIFPSAFSCVSAREARCHFMLVFPFFTG